MSSGSWLRASVTLILDIHQLYITEHEPYIN